MINKLISDVTIAPEGGFKGIGKLGSPEEGGVTTFAKFISGVIAVLTVVAIIWFLFVLITGAISIISSGGDKQALETAKKKITTGIIGLVVVILAVVIMNVLGTVLGIPNILNISSLLAGPLGK